MRLCEHFARYILKHSVSDEVSTVESSPLNSGFIGKRWNCWSVIGTFWKELTLNQFWDDERELASKWVRQKEDRDQRKKYFGPPKQRNTDCRFNFLPREALKWRQEELAEQTWGEVLSSECSPSSTLPILPALLHCSRDSARAPTTCCLTNIQYRTRGLQKRLSCWLLSILPTLSTYQSPLQIVRGPRE